MGEEVAGEAEIVRLLHQFVNTSGETEYFYLASNPSCRTAVTNDDHADGTKVSAGPSGTLLSRTGTTPEGT